MNKGNVLILLPGGSDPQILPEYKKHFAELVKLSKEYGFTHGEVLYLPGHESYVPRTCWDIGEAANVLKRKVEELAQQYDTITINARCGGCDVVLRYLEEGQGNINKKINSIRLWGAVSWDKINEIYESKQEAGFRKNGLSFNEASLKSYNGKSFTDYFDEITLPDNLTIKIGFGGRDDLVPPKKEIEEKINNSKNKDRITIIELKEYEHLVESPLPDDFLKFCFE